MNKYYCTGEVLENGYLKCVKPDFNAHWTESYIASLPLAALVVGGKIGWLEGYEERYEYAAVKNKWEACSKEEYEKQHPAFWFRIVLVKKPEEKSEVEMSLTEQAFAIGSTGNSASGKTPEWVLKERYDKVLKALRNLCHLKKWKDEHGKDHHYEQFQPEAWAYAFDVLEDLNEKITVAPVVEDRPKAEKLAVKFHEFYEQLAPQFGYETRKETKEFNPDSQNGKLMIATCNKILEWLSEGQNT